MPTTSTANIRYTIKIKKVDLFTLGRGWNSKNGTFTPGRVLKLPDRKTLLDGTYTVTTCDDKQKLFPSEVTETQDDYVVTGTLSSGHYPPMNQQGELDLFRLNNKYQEIDSAHYEFFQGNCRLAPPGFFRDQHPFITVMTIPIKIKGLLNALTSEYLQKVVEWHYDPKKNAAWLEKLSEADFTKVKNALLLGDIDATIKTKSVDKSKLLLLENVSIEKLEKLTNSSYNQVLAEQSRSP